MAKEAVMGGVRSYHMSQNEFEKQNKLEKAGKPYNYTTRNAYYEGVRVAAEVLWKLFASCSADCQSAIEKVSQKRDGFCEDPDAYFDDFVLALEAHLHGAVRIRERE